MINIKEKKIPVAILLISIIVIIIGYLIKDSYNNHGSIQSLYDDRNYPLKYYEIYVFGYIIEYTTFLSAMLLILGLGIYSLLFKTDEEIKLFYTKCLDKLLSLDLFNRSFKTLNKMLSHKADANEIDQKIVITETESNIEVKTVNNTITETENKRIRKIKERTLIIGIVILILTLLEYNLIFNRREFYMYPAMILIIIQKFFAANKCDQLKGDSWVWFFFGFMMPSIALILASLTLESKNEVAYEK